MTPTSRPARFFLSGGSLAAAWLLGSAACMAAPPPGYRLVWHDEFHGPVGSPPDPASWSYNTGDNGWGNNEMEDYVNDTEHAHVVADKAATDGRALQIEATSDGNPAARDNYKSARLLTHGKVAEQYGYIEARLRLPSGQGLWPAFWMLGDNIFDPGIGWPNCGEMDIMENIGSRPGVNEASLHGPGYSGSNSLHAYYTLPGGAKFSDGYHLFGILWSPNSVQYSVDGHVYETRTPADIPGKPWAFNHPFFFVLNLAVGGNFPGSPDATTQFPQTLRVDYVRVYQLTKR